MMREEYSAPTSLRVRVLGPLEVYRDGGLVALPSGQMSRLLGVLLLRAGSVVPVDTLLEVLWDNDFPGSARTLIQARMSRLRQVFGSGLATLSGSRRGYRLDIPPGVLDLHEFRELRAQAVGKAPEVVEDLLRGALFLWRGPALAELGATIRGRQLTQALQEEHLAAVEAHADAALACGRHDGIALGLADVLAVHPLRERLRAQLMLVLHRSGRQAEALAVFDEGRRLLAEELGLDPGSELCAAHAAVLAGNAKALAPARGGSSRRVADRLRESRRRRFVGRVAEIAVFQAAVTRVEPTAAVLFVHGPVGGRRYQVVARDMRRLSPAKTLERQADGVTAAFEQPLTPPKPPTPVVVLSKSEFAEAVRQALRDLRRPDRLRRNPLLQSRLVREPAAHQPFSDTEMLRRLVQEEAETLRDDSPEHEAYRALDRTYLHPAPTRRQAAEALDLPLRVYRRHLAAATDRMIELLWQRELHTPDSGIGSPATE